MYPGLGPAFLNITQFWILPQVILKFIVSSFKVIPACAKEVFNTYVSVYIGINSAQNPQISESYLKAK
jgi:hypothetical protein